MLKNLDKHAQLMNQMSDNAIVDLGDAMIKGRLNGLELRDAVFNCIRCLNSEECQALVGSRSGSTGVIPEYCLNREMFRRLQ